MPSVSAVGSWSASRPWRAIGLWLSFVVVALALGALTGTESLSGGAVGESARGYELLEQHGAWPPASEYAYLRSETLRVEDPPFQRATRDVAARMARLLDGPVDVRNSDDRHAAVVIAEINAPFEIDRLRSEVLAAGASHPQVTIEHTGDVTAGEARDRAVDGDLQRAELLSVPVTLVVLLFAFGAIFAALLPVGLALTAVAATFGLLGPISQVFPIDDATKIVVVLIGMAVGVDYALFYVIRSREERRRGLSSHAALEVTARTSGRTVVVSGATVAIAMAGMFVIDADIFNSIASGTIAVVACAVIGSVTVLPAVLERLGDRIDRGRIPFLPHLRTETADSRFWPTVVDLVLRRPFLSCIASAAVLLALAAPALWLSVSLPGEEALAARDEPALATLARIRAEFPSTGTPALVVVAGPPEQRAEALAAIDELTKLAEGRGIAHPPFRVSGAADGNGASVELPLVGAGDNDASRHAIEVLREELVPATLGQLAGVETAVTGDVAEDVDFTRQMKHGMPYVIAFVLSLAFVLLLVAFRSIVVPLKAIVLNLLSVAAAYGVLVLVFQHEWAEPILGFESNGAIVSWLPPFLFVILFGLSMDYHVFILSRVREGVVNGMTSDAAVRYGITATAGVVTSAALVMVGVFSIFGTLSSLDVKQAGVGLAAAVLIDATILRAVLLPSSMHLLGDWNWYLPRALGRFARPPAAPPSRDAA